MKRHKPRVILPPVRSDAERNAIVLDNLRLVPWALFKMEPDMRWLRRYMGWSDAVQEGRIGLMRAASLWKPELGKFTNYAVHWIRGRFRNLVAVHLKKHVSGRISFNINKHDAADGFSFADLDLRSVIGTLLAEMSDRQCEVIRLRFGLGGSGVQTFAAIGKILGVTQERIRQIELRVMWNLREEFRYGDTKLGTMLGLSKCRNKACSHWSEFSDACSICSVLMCEQCVRPRTAAGRHFLACSDCFLAERHKAKEAASTSENDDPWDRPLAMWHVTTKAV